MHRLTLVAAVFFIAASALAQEPAPRGTEMLRIDSKIMGEERVVLVRTSPGCDNPSDRCPVLYMTDGDTSLTHTAATVDYLARNGRIPPLIVVGILNTDRTRDLTPSGGGKMVLPSGQGIDLPTAGGGNRFLDFIEKELIPLIEKNYRTEPFRIFAGHSYGGMLALHVLTSRPHLFQGIISASPTLTWDSKFPLRTMSEFLKNRRELKSTLYVTIGNEGRALDRAFEQLKSTLESSRVKDFSWGADRLGDEDHGSLLLPTHYRGLRKIFETWRVPQDVETLEIRGGWKGAQEHYRKLSERLGYENKIPEGVANLIGYQLATEGKLDAA